MKQAAAKTNLSLPLTMPRRRAVQYKSLHSLEEMFKMVMEAGENAKTIDLQPQHHTNYTKVCIPAAREQGFQEVL